MEVSFFNLIKLCVLLALSFWSVGFIFQLVATHRMRRGFREKGFLRIPEGREWVMFLLMRRYELFDDTAAKILYAASRACMIGLIFSLSAILLLLLGTVFLYVLSEATP